MEHRNRTILTICIAAVIVVAVLSSFGLNLFAPDTAKIVFPTPAVTTQPGDDPAGPGGTGLVRVEVTPDTVQSVIRTLARPASYYREVTVEDRWGTEESGVTTAQVWADHGWTKTEAVWPGGTVRHSIVGDETVWLWYNNDRDVVTAGGDDASEDLESQRIPTYEDVLELDQKSITATGYEDKGGLSCIYVETQTDELDYQERYWVAVDSGLLVAAETLSGGQVVYSMSAYTLERPAPADTAFALPDGTVLHTVGA